MSAHGPLTGIRVLDLSRVLSGPSCGKALADLGADVVKVEPPEGDLTRTAQPRVGRIPVYYAQQNAGKRSVSIDLHTDRGRELALGLIAVSDVVVENFRPGVLARLGLGYEAGRAANPRVIYCSITGYGQDGPLAHRRAYAPVMHAELGLMELTARTLGVAPRSEPVSHADLHSGLQATVGILAALVQRDRTGEGQHIDVSMAEVMLQATEWTAVELAGGTQGRFHVFGGTHAPVLRLGDGTVVCVPGDPVSTFPAWCQAVGDESLLSDERFATPEARHENRSAMLEVLAGFAADFEDFDSFEAAIGPARLAAGQMRPVSDVGSAEWAEVRGALVDLGPEVGQDAGPAGDPMLLPRSPFRFSAAAAGVRGPVAWQGQHNHEVLGELLGLHPDEVTAMEAEGVLASRQSAIRAAPRPQCRTRAAGLRRVPATRNQKGHLPWHEPVPGGSLFS